MDFSRLKEQKERIEKFLSEGMWTIDIHNLGKHKRRWLGGVQLTSLMLKTFKEEKIGLQSASLSYFCFIAVVPFIAVAFALTGGLGLDSILADFLTREFGEYPIVTETVLNGAERILQTAQSGWFGLFSSLFFAWLVIWMMMCVERVFNAAWKVDKSRNFFKRLSTDLVILVLAPFIVLLFVTTSMVYTNFLDLIVPKVDFSDSIKTFLGWVVFGVISIFVISAMYKFIPNAKVRYSCALKAAIVAGLAFTLLQYLYIETQLLVSRVNMVYGTVAAIPLFMLWMRFSWLIMLYGCELSYAIQNVDEYRELLGQPSENFLEERNGVQQDTSVDEQ